MRFGCCVNGHDAIKIVAQAGYDFCELPAAAVQPFEEELSVLPDLRALAAAPLRPEAFNMLLPSSLPLVGPQADHAELRSYLRRAFKRMVQLGAVVVVLGSGAARHIPPDFSRKQGLDQLAEALAIAVDQAQRAGIILALEHLNQGETNVWNSLEECRRFIEDRSLYGVQLLADLHHLELEREPLDDVLRAGSLLAHVHVADGGRQPPGTDGYNYDGFMRVLQLVGYDRRISAECVWDDLAAQARPALAFMRQCWDSAATA